MGEKRQHYTEEFKRQTAKYMQGHTKTVPEIAEELGIPAGVLYKWKGLYREFANESLASLEKINQLEQLLQEKELENQQKDRENADLREELEILKKAVHIFSKQKN